MKDILPIFVRKRIEKAIEEAIHPKVMSTHSGKAVVQVSDLQYLLKAYDMLNGQSTFIDAVGSTGCKASTEIK